MTGGSAAEGAEALADLIRTSKHMVVLTGAGASTESGLPDFRSAGGLWKQRDPRQVASIQAFRSEPITFYQFYAWRLEHLGNAQPNPVHYALASLEQAGYLKALVTQNVDGLHQQAGSQQVFEVHGNIREAKCSQCGRIYGSEKLKVAVESFEDAPRCQCGGLLRPNVVLFGEGLPEAELNHAVEQSSSCDLMVVIGTSLQVGPINMLPEIALDNGARVSIINRDPTPLDSAVHLVLRGNAGEVLTETCQLLDLKP